ncbi:MAG: hypothetical protein HYV97_12250 [Bdellovibrio sp.]|nr:hypothetical protein [Bdellovibrio sp.]
MNKLLLFTVLLMWSVLQAADDIPNSGDESGAAKKDNARTSVPEGLKKSYGDSKMRATQVGEAEPYRQSTRISRKYSEGEFLIYDCQSRHFACVDEASYQRCKSERKTGLDTKASRVLPCAPLKFFSKFADCTKKQYVLQHRRHNKSMCLVELGAASN